MREEDFDVTKLQNYRLISRILCVRNGLNVADFDLLLYLNPIKLFNKHDFDEGKFTLSWDQNRFRRLVKDGWIKKVSDGRGWNSGHTKYTLSQKAKLMFNKLSKLIDKKEDIPYITKPETRAQRRLNYQAERFNNLKYGDEGIHS